MEEYIMKTAYIDLVKHAIKGGNTVSVFDGEEWSTVKSTKFKTIIDDINGVEEAQIRIRDVLGNQLGWALISPYGVSPDETVIDMSDNEYMNNWSNAYEGK
jgi:hypothetical protein